jgi:hypothetical protein
MRLIWLSGRFRQGALAFKKAAQQRIACARRSLETEEVEAQRCADAETV